MSIRKRSWTTQKGEAKEAWIVAYADQFGKRHIKTFDRKKDADEYHATVKVDVRHGIHAAESSSITVAQAADDWITFVKLEGREGSTFEQYERHVKLHIAPRIGREKLSKLTTPRVQAFRDDLLASLSRAQARKVLTSLKMLLRDAKRRGNATQNVAVDVKIGTDPRDKRKLKIGVDIPTPDEIRRILHVATGRSRAFLITAIFTGLRSSEIRGLCWSDIDFKKAELHVRQRVDRYNNVGLPKSKAGDRMIPLGPIVVNTLKEWRLACPKGDLGLVFPNTLGKFEDHGNVINRVLCPTLIAAGVVDVKGEAKYTGLHALRHFYASWCINRKADGGLELPAKTVQSRMGHSSIVVTMDT
jgi:integrase